MVENTGKRERLRHLRQAIADCSRRWNNMQSGTYRKHSRSPRNGPDILAAARTEKVA
jgi:hypothetical protein